MLSDWPERQSAYPCVLGVRLLEGLRGVLCIMKSEKVTGHLRFLPKLNNSLPHPDVKAAHGVCLSQCEPTFQLDKLSVNLTAEYSLLLYMW